MKINFGNMCQNEQRKAGILQQFAVSQLNWDLSGYGEIGVNPNSGNTYLWLEDEPACIYIPICGNDKIFASYSCPNCGEEIEAEIEDRVDYDDFIESLGTCQNCEEKF